MRNDQNTIGTGGHSDRGRLSSPFRGASRACFGPECYFLTFAVCCGACCVGALLMLALWRRTRDFYRAKDQALTARRAPRRWEDWAARPQGAGGVCRRGLVFE